MVIAHRCDNPACFNPEHLFLCTQAENLADMRSKGRGNTGERHGSKTKPERVARGERVGTSKLSAEQVAVIRAAYKPGRPGHPSETSLTGLARRYGVTFQTISKIVNKRSWA
jgi:predicted DNA binding protein